jgi:hypothetical protein
LILETPNPENIRVGATSFYLDPTHQRPLPPGLLSFLPKHYGFARVKIIRLQESPDLVEGRRIALSDVLGGVSPDYAVIAQKAAEASVMTATGRAFEAEYGLTLEALVGRFDRQLADQAQALEVLQAEAAEERAKGNDELARLAATLEATALRTQELELQLQLASSRAHQDLDRVLDEMRGPLARQEQALQRLEHALERGRWRPFDSLAKPFRKARTAGLIAFVPRPLRALFTNRIHGALSGTKSSAASLDDTNRRNALSRFLRRMGNSVSKRYRKFARRDLPASRGERLPIDQLDLSAEPESVQRLYLRLVQARERIPRSGDRA